MWLMPKELGQYKGKLRFPGTKFKFDGDEEDIPSWAMPLSGYKEPKEEKQRDDYNIRRDQEVINAVATLEHDNDEHWTRNGNPSVSAVNALTSFRVSSSDIRNLCPEVTRKPESER